MQKLVLEQDSKRYVPSVPTHFYQVDPKEGKEKITLILFPVCFIIFFSIIFITEICSTTRKDFLRPEEVV